MKAKLLMAGALAAGTGFLLWLLVGAIIAYMGPAYPGMVYGGG